MYFLPLAWLLGPDGPRSGGFRRLSYYDLWDRPQSRAGHTRQYRGWCWLGRRRSTGVSIVAAFGAAYLGREVTGLSFFAPILLLGLELFAGAPRGTATQGGYRYCGGWHRGRRRILDLWRRNHVEICCKFLRALIALLVGVAGFSTPSRAPKPVTSSSYSRKASSLSGSAAARAC